jgi:hypothetical protein
MLFARETGENWQRYPTITQHGWKKPHLERSRDGNVCATAVQIWSKKPVPLPAKTRTRERGYGFSRVRVRVALEYPRVTRAIP